MDYGHEIMCSKNQNLKKESFFVKKKPEYFTSKLHFFIRVDILTSCTSLLRGLHSSTKKKTQKKKKITTGSWG